ncbi:hypothetical protein [Specibacter cremeus]|uniref:hypothetical protein n=1 Tax=Specibacter cremeus TaxID=1629051 RepID=UPI000F7B5C6B|nr:hypothetical protein [Specibacter cremeus]
MIDWLAFLTVLIVTLIGAGFVVLMYSLGVRLTAVSADPDVSVTRAAKWAAYACFIICAASVLFGIWLLIPHFH